MTMAWNGPTSPYWPKQPADETEFRRQLADFHGRWRVFLNAWFVDEQSRLAALEAVGYGPWQPLKPSLTALGALTPGTDRLPYWSGPSTAANTSFKASGRSIVGLDLAAKGDLIAATGAAVASVKTVSATDHNYLAADSSQADGLAYEFLPQLTVVFLSAAATAAGARTTGICTSTAIASRQLVPAGKSFKVLSVLASVETGAIGGTYEMDAVIYNHTDSAETVLATFPVVDSGIVTNVYAVGTLAAPLATIAASKTFSIGWNNNGTSPGPLSTNSRTIFVSGVFV